MSNELKDCPFCGREPEQSERADNNTSTGRAYFIACMCGGYSANAHQFGETKEEVTRKWNCRPIAPVASAAPSGELPPLPEPFGHIEVEDSEGWCKDILDGWTADQVFAYARAAIAHQPPKESLTDEQLGNLYQWTFESQPDCRRTAPKPAPLVIAYGRAVADAASAPNKQLVAALKGILAVMDYESLWRDDPSMVAARAALAAAGEVQS